MTLRGYKQTFEHIAKRKRFGKAHKGWKGDAVSYGVLHAWVRRYLPEPVKCQHCKKVPSYDLANRSGKYLRKLSDWWYLCRRCHMKLDGRLFSFHRPMYGKRNGNWKDGSRVKNCPIPRGQLLKTKAYMKKYRATL